MRALVHPVRIALVGLGGIAVRAHLPALLHESGAELVAMVEIDRARLTAASSLAPDVLATNSFEDVLADPTVDARPCGSGSSASQLSTGLLAGCGETSSTWA